MTKYRAVTVCSFCYCHWSRGSRLVLFVGYQHVVFCSSCVASTIHIVFVVVHNTLLLFRVTSTHTVSLSTGLVSMRLTWSSFLIVTQSAPSISVDLVSLRFVIFMRVGISICYSTGEHRSEVSIHSTFHSFRTFLG